MRVGGFAGEVAADSLGRRSRRAVLFQFYSPKCSRRRECLAALRSNRGAQTSAGRAAMAGAAERRLRLWGVDAGEIAAIARRGRRRNTCPCAPISGYVVEKEIVAGSAIEMGQRVYRIAPLDRVWIEAEV
jgi:Cu(I)/Ag(I) efflux system membrane fusion protein